jgi:hypothetical protein
VTRPTITLMLPEYRVDQSMGGIGVRALDLATAMSAQADVTIVCNQPTDLPNLPCPALAARCTDLMSLIAKSDAVVFFDLGSINLLRHAVATDRFIVAENAVPLEHLEYNAERPAAERDARYKDYVTDFRAQVAAADHFLTRSQIERRLLIGALALEGRLSPDDIRISPCLEHLITNVPIGICTRDLVMNTTATPIPGLFLWTGGLWDYMAYETAIEGFSGAGSSARLCFLYRPPEDQHLRAHDVFAASDTLSDQITFLGRDLPHTQRGAVIERANGLICVARPGIENETCVRLRVRDTLLYRRPIIVDLNGATGEYVRATGIGIALPELSSRALSDAVSQMEPDSDQYHNFLVAIDRERRETVLEYRLEGFFHAGRTCNWKSPRDRARILSRLDQVVPEVRSEDRSPFIS